MRSILLTFHKRKCFAHSILELGRNFIFFREVAPHASEWFGNSKIKGQKVKVTEKENVKIVFRTILRHSDVNQNQNDLCSFHTYLRIHFAMQRKCLVLVIFVWMTACRNRHLAVHLVVISALLNFINCRLDTSAIHTTCIYCSICVNKYEESL